MSVWTARVCSGLFTMYWPLGDKMVNFFVWDFNLLLRCSLAWCPTSWLILASLSRLLALTTSTWPARLYSSELVAVFTGLLGTFWTVIDYWPWLRILLFSNSSCSSWSAVMHLWADRWLCNWTLILFVTQSTSSFTQQLTTPFVNRVLITSFLGFLTSLIGSHIWLPVPDFTDMYGVHFQTFILWTGFGWASVLTLFLGTFTLPLLDTCAGRLALSKLHGIKRTVGGYKQKTCIAPWFSIAK